MFDERYLIVTAGDAGSADELVVSRWTTCVRYATSPIKTTISTGSRACVDLAISKKLLEKTASD